MCKSTLKKMERLLVKGTSEELQQIADLAAKLGLKAEYMPEEISYTVNEPATLQDWDTLSKAQQDGILDAIEDVKLNGGIPHGEVMKAMRKKYE